MVVQIVDDVAFVLIVLVVMNVLDVSIVTNVLIVRISQDTDGHIKIFNMMNMMILLMLYINATATVKLIVKPMVKLMVIDTKKYIKLFFYNLSHKF